LLGFDPDFTQEKFEPPALPAKKRPGRVMGNRKETRGRSAAVRKAGTKRPAGGGTRRKS
jgi:hypothetical protein